MRNKILLAAFTGFAIHQPAWADALDGEWCHEGRQLTIEGPKMVTASGASIEGDYRRHTFSYTAPEGDLHAGKTVFIRQVHDGLMILTPEGGVAEEWKRCEFRSS